MEYIDTKLHILNLGTQVVIWWSYRLVAIKLAVRGKTSNQQYMFLVQHESTKKLCNEA